MWMVEDEVQLPSEGERDAKVSLSTVELYLQMGAYGFVCCDARKSNHKMVVLSLLLLL